MIFFLNIQFLEGQNLCRKQVHWFSREMSTHRVDTMEALPETQKYIEEMHSLMEFEYPIMVPCEMIFEKLKNAKYVSLKIENNGFFWKFPKFFKKISRIFQKIDFFKKNQKKFPFLRVYLISCINRLLGCGMLWSSLTCSGHLQCLTTACPSSV